jgi:uncharacterized protein
MELERVKQFVMVSHGDFAAVQEMLAEQPDLLQAQFEWRPGDWENGLQAASHVGNRPIAEFFLAQGIPSNICTVAMLGRIDEVQVFLTEDPALANARGAHGIGVMYHAALSGNIALAGLLKSAGCTEGYNHALHGAIAYGHRDMVVWLLENGVTDSTMKDYMDKTPLERAQEAGLTEIVALLEARRV